MDLGKRPSKLGTGYQQLSGPLGTKRKGKLPFLACANSDVTYVPALVWPAVASIVKTNLSRMTPLTSYITPNQGSPLSDRGLCQFNILAVAGGDYDKEKY